jgi:hypothetical protein
MDDTDSCIKFVTEEPITARYVKMTFGVSGGAFVFCSEFLVGVKEGIVVEESKPEESKPEESIEPEETVSEQSVPAISQAEKPAEEGLGLWLWIILGGAVVIVAVIAILAIRKKK